MTPQLIDHSFFYYVLSVQRAFMNQCAESLQILIQQVDVFQRVDTSLASAITFALGNVHSAYGLKGDLVDLAESENRNYFVKLCCNMSSVHGMKKAIHLLH